MRIAIALCLALLVAPAYAGNMVEAKPRLVCGKIPELDCSEWRFTDIPDLHFVVSGLEDGSNSTFYRVGKRGKYKQLFDLFPITRDRKGRDLSDFGDFDTLPFERNADGIIVWATFDHSLLDAGGPNCHSADLKGLPAVLFLGEFGQNGHGPFVGTEHFHFHRMSLATLATQARTLARGQKAQINSCGR